jgi:plasmid stabilization system protein ParE
MNVKIIYRPQVVTDLAEAAIWYKGRRPGLEAEFLADFEQTLAAIERNPLQYQTVERDLRRAMMRDFPYGIFYAVREDHLLVVACLHSRRNPATWRERLR